MEQMDLHQQYNQEKLPPQNPIQDAVIYTYKSYSLWVNTNLQLT